MIDLDTLLNPIREDAPGGDDLEYDDDFIALELASKPSEERVIGDTVIPAEDPDFEDVARKAAALLARTQDLRVAGILANALLRTGGLPGFCDALCYIEGALRTHWEHVHPQLDEDDGDPTMRVNAALALADRGGLLRSLRHAPLINSAAFGPLSLRDLELACGDATPPAGTATPPDPQTIAAAVQDAGPDAIAATLDAAISASKAVAAISGIFDAQVGALGPDLDPLQKILGDIRRRVAVFSDDPVVPDLAEDPTPEPAAVAPTGAAPGGAITSPQDVTAALDRIMAYYARCEPSSPLPILLTRAKRLVSADFVTIMKDMAPEGVGNVALIGGFEPDGGEGGTY